MKVIDIINRAIVERTPRFTVEMLPPLKGEGAEGIFGAINNIIEYNPAYINITNHREAIRYIKRADGSQERRLVHERPGTVGISVRIRQHYGIEVVPHIICGGKSCYDIEDELIDLDFLGIENILALRGDTVGGERHFVAHRDGYTYASELVHQIGRMNSGYFLDGNDRVGHKTNFCTGVAGYPEKHVEAPDMESDITNLCKKIDSGAQYIVTQMSYSTERIINFVRRCRAAGIEVPIIAGIKPLTTAAQLTLLPQTFNVEIPQELVSAVARCHNNEQVREVGIEWAITQSKELIKAGIPLIHFYTMSRTEGIVRILRELFG